MGGTKELPVPPSPRLLLASSKTRPIFAVGERRPAKPNKKDSINSSSDHVSITSLAASG
jgi:hypothetical protein